MPVRVNEIFFRNFDLQPMGGFLRWRILAGMLLTGYALFFGGLLISARTLAILFPAPRGDSLLPLSVITSMVFMHNLIQTPAYATLTAFGVSCLATYCWVQAWESGLGRAQFASGIAMGMLVLVRLEAVILCAVLGLGLLLMRRWRFLGWFVLGGLIPLALLLTYNMNQFGNPFHAGILRGNMNILTFERDFVFAGLLAPRSGLVWYSALNMLGLVGLWVSHEARLKMLGWGAWVLVALVLLRVPVMFYCVGKGAQTISDVAVTCPPDWNALRQLIRFDVNRYVIPLAPFSVLGLRTLLTKVLKFPEKSNE